MAEKKITSWYAMSDPALLEVLGGFIRQVRLQKNKTQLEVAQQAGVNRSTIVQIEKGGGGTLLTFMQILRALEQLHVLESFETTQQLSPLQLAKAALKKRQRASNKKTVVTIKTKSAW